MTISTRKFLEAAQELEKSSIPFVVVTLVSTRGHAPQDPGAKAIVTEEGLRWGTVGGGKVEARTIQHSKDLLAKASLETIAPELLTWNLQRDIGMTCGGEVTYLFEVHRRDAWKIVIFGAGHVAQALVRALDPLDCQITCIDPRTEWIARLPQASNKLAIIQTEEPALCIESLPADAFFVVMTQGHATDMPILDALLKKHPHAPYAGVIGSDVKAIKIRAELKARNFPEDVVKRLRCPIGLPLGGNHPGEIAISVVAELLQVRDSLANA